MSGIHIDAALIQQAILFLLVLIASIAVHEFGHAFVADRLGDRLARSEGRVTLNPLAHADLWGTVVFPVMAVLVHAPLLGWGKPVRHSLSRSRLPGGLSMKTAQLLVSAAGPAMNLLLALVLSVPFVVLLRAGHVGAIGAVQLAISLNIYLAFFNLIPCPPLDGRSILFWFLPEQHPVVAFLEKYGPFIFLALLFLPQLLGVLMWPATWLSNTWFGLLVRVGAGS